MSVMVRLGIWCGHEGLLDRLLIDARRRLDPGSSVTEGGMRQLVHSKLIVLVLFYSKQFAIGIVLHSLEVSEL